MNRLLVLIGLVVSFAAVSPAAEDHSRQSLQNKRYYYGQPVLRTTNGRNGKVEVHLRVRTRRGFRNYKLIAGNEKVATTLETIKGKRRGQVLRRIRVLGTLIPQRSRYQRVLKVEAIFGRVGTKSGGHVENN